MNPILEVPHYQQSAEGYCLPACARMVLAYLGLERTEAEIAKVLGTREFGTPGFAIQRLRSWGLQVDFGTWTETELLSALAAKQPVIAFVKTGFLDYWQEDFAHAIVVVGASSDQQFWVNDPDRSQAPLMVSLNGLWAAWGEFSYQGAVLKLQRPNRLVRFLRRFFFNSKEQD